MAHIIIGWFAHVFDDPRSDWDFKTKHEWYSEVEKLDRRTLQGETVASFEELLIANWLYRNGISYEYEPAYEVDLPGAGKRVYLPDFRLTESGVYIEHFGVRKRCGRDGREELVTAPFIDQERYLAEMQWKRQVHAENGTVLVETYSWERSEGHLLESLAKKLAPHVKLKPRPPDQIYDRVVAMGSADSFSSLLGTFLRHFKSGGYSVAGCEEKAIKLKMGTRAKAFLTIFDAAFREYQIRLGNRIDFEDMVARATGHVEAGQYRSPYRHILVDEFQDISLGRARLIKALKRQHPDARLFAVGDDWQSIYRFAGSDIHIMRNFGHEFGGTFADTNDVHCTVDLGRTFRSVDKIALSARKFVLRNPAQITKTVVSAGTADRPAIRVVWTRKDCATERLRDVLSQIASGASLGDRKPTVLIVGRYRRSDPGVANLQCQYPSLSLTYKTIHSSKGLEADHVVLVGADGGRLGFPSETVDDPLLGLVSPETEPFEHAEERRVMYVAMTRARHSMTILASEFRPSAFVTELMNDPTYEVAGPGDIAAQTLTCGECGGRLIFMPTQEGRPWYRCEHVQLCGNRLPACPTCDVGLPRHMPSSADLVCSKCSTHFQDCPKCRDGWLVERTGRYGRFLGCVRFPSCEATAKLDARQVGSQSVTS